MPAVSAKFLNAVPKLAALDIPASIGFYEQIGFSKRWQEENYAVLVRDGIEIHLWKCEDKRIAENTACRINVRGIQELYEEFQALKLVHPNDPLKLKPWNLWEFSILDRDGNLITFSENPNKETGAS